MLTVETRHAIHPDHAKGMDTAGLREHFLGEGLFADGEIRLIYTHYDRFTLGGAVPAGGTGSERRADTKHAENGKETHMSPRLDP